MKKLIALIILFSSCKDKGVKQHPNHSNVSIQDTSGFAFRNYQTHLYPRYVKNKCGQWAVQTGLAKSSDEWGNEIYVKQYFGDNMTFYSSDRYGNYDTLEMQLFSAKAKLESSLGNEYQFKDSLSAVDSYRNHLRILHGLLDRKAERERAKQIADSIYKCKHTYE